MGSRGGIIEDSDIEIVDIPIRRITASDIDRLRADLTANLGREFTSSRDVDSPPHVTIMDSDPPDYLTSSQVLTTTDGTSPIASFEGVARIEGEIIGDSGTETGNNGSQIGFAQSEDRSSGMPIETVPSIAQEPILERHFRPRQAIQLKPYSYDKAVYDRFLNKITKSSHERRYWKDSSQSQENENENENSQLETQLSQEPYALDLRHESGDIQSGAIHSGQVSTVRPRLIDSDSESDMSDIDDHFSSDSDADLLGPEVRTAISSRKKIRGVLPASVALVATSREKLLDLTRESQNSGVAGESQVLSQNLSFDESLEWSQYGETPDIPEVSAIDHMPAARIRATGSGTGSKVVRINPTRTRKTTVMLPALVRSLGMSARPYMRVAARTAEKRGRAIDSPHRKLIVMHDRFSDSAHKTLRRWRRGEFSTTEEPSDMLNSRSHMLSRDSRPRHLARPVNRTVRLASMATMATEGPRGSVGDGTNLRNGSRNFPSKRRATILGDHEVNALTANDIEDHAKKKRRQPRRSPRDGEYFTTTVEIPSGKYGIRQGQATQLGLPMVPPSGQASFQPGQARGAFPVAARDAHINAGDAFNMQLIPRRTFTKSTFLGSNVLDLLGSPGMWDGCRHNQSLPAYGSSIETISSAELDFLFDKLQELASGSLGELDSTLYSQVYDYMLVLSVDLIRQDIIVDPSRRQKVVSKLQLICDSVAGKSYTQEQPYLARLRMLVALASIVLADAPTMKAIQEMRSELFVLRASGWAIILAHLGFIFVSFVNARKFDLTATYGQDSIAIETVLFTFRSGRLSKLIERSIAGDQALPLYNHHWTLIALAAQARSYYRSSNWEDGWPLVLRLIRTQDLSTTPRAAVLGYCIKLIYHWGWRVCPDVVFLFFDFHSRIQNYADPAGESLNLPRFVSVGKFDGSTPRWTEHHLFLEFLGMNLRGLGHHNLSASRRIVGRLTPLSNFTFPDTSPVKVGDLSAVSQQYSILLVCFRFAAPQARPSVAQIADLVAIDRAHIALRIQALSAWQMLVKAHHELQIKDYSASRSWLEKLCQGSLDQYEAFKRTGEQPGAVRDLNSFFEELYRGMAAVGPSKFLNATLASPILHGLPETVRHQFWRCASVADFIGSHNSDSILEVLSQYFADSEAGEWEATAFGRILASKPTRILAEASSLRSSRLEPAFVTGVLEAQSGPFDHQVGSYLMRSVVSFSVRADWTGISAVFEKLHKRERWVPRIGQDTDLQGRVNLVQELLDPRNKYALFPGYSKDEELAKFVLAEMRREYQAVKGCRRQLEYEPFVAQVRRIIFERFPELSAGNSWFNDASEHLAVEISQRNLIASLKKQSTRDIEYFFAYKLRDSLLKDDGESFMHDVLEALELRGAELRVQAFDLVVNGLFAFYARLAKKNRVVYGRLSLFIEITIRLTDRDDQLHFAPFQFLLQLARLLDQSLSLGGRIVLIRDVVEQIYELATTVLRQAYIRKHSGTASDGEFAWVDQVMEALYGMADKLRERATNEHKTWRVEYDHLGDAIHGDEDALLSALEGLQLGSTERGETIDWKFAAENFQSLYKTYLSSELLEAGEDSGHIYS